MAEFALSWCGENKTVPISETAEVPRVLLPAPEAPTIVKSRFRQGVVFRHRVRQRVSILPNAEGEAGAIDISDIIESVEVSEKINEDIEATIILMNKDFSLNDLVFFETGHRFKVEMFDGRDWLDWGAFILIKPDRSYAEGSKFTLTCRSERVKFQRSSRTFKWENKRLSEVIAEIARACKWQAEINIPPEKDYVEEEIQMARESITAFLQRKAREKSLWFKVSGKRLYFRAKVAEDTGITLKYRPAFPEIGSILSARSSQRADKAKSNKKGRRKKGSVAYPKVRSINFKDGTLGQELLDSLAKKSLFQIDDMITPPDAGEEAFYASKLDVLNQALSENIAEENNDDAGDALSDTVSFNVPTTIIRDHTTEEIDAVKAQLYNANELHNYELEISTYGMADLRIERILTVAGLSIGDSGRWLIEGDKHSVSGSAGYRCQLKLTRPTKPPAPKRKVPLPTTSATRAASGTKSAVIPIVESTWGVAAGGGGVLSEGR